MKPLFIVFEGIDGSGTTTQANMLNDYLNKNSTKSIVTSEPTSGPIGNLIRQAMKKRVIFTDNEQQFDHQMAYLFAADRHDHLYNKVDGVFKHNGEGTHVISTRYYFSSLAYHCDNKEDFSFVRSLNERFPNPDLLIYIDNPVETSIQRLSTRSVIDVYENREKLSRVKENYEKIIQDYSNRYMRVQGNQGIIEIHDEIINYIKENFYDRIFAY
ncbi:dTMP kinase [Bacillus sp. FJAT-27264]|uniref:dTMP kinase n=1 Tax=Paenibacillus sp. (strain DSM 101736 / FJAT-27264) TaxID=1850362 RepID=UPI0008080575|nr:dTMP kinase [Bacillus sp. FJAT-27264]OBZ07549.1 dTMP kinase [Bacillus sp. FJAT-27264]